MTLVIGVTETQKIGSLWRKSGWSTDIETRPISCKGRCAKEGFTTDTENHTHWFLHSAEKMGW